MDLKSIEELLNKYGTMVVNDAIFGNYRCAFTGGWVDKRNGAMRLSIRKYRMNDVYNSLHHGMLSEVNKIERENGY